MKNKILLLLVLALPCNLFAASNALTFSKNKTQITVRFKANATTGYRWLLTSKPSWIKVVSSKYIPDKAPKGFVGVGGVSVWKLKIISGLRGSRLGEICWRYAQPWQPQGDDKCQKIVYIP